MNVNLKLNLSLPFTPFKNQVLKYSCLSKKITAIASVIFISFIALCLIRLSKLAIDKLSCKISNAEASRAFHKSLEEWKNDPLNKGDKQTACKRISKAFDKKSSYLDLAGLSLESLPNAIGSLTQLKTLNLANNQLKSLPEIIGNLTQLNTLNLANNQIKFLTEIIGNLTQLDILNLTNNQLESLPEAIGKLIHLTTLNLGRNQLRVFPQCINNLVALRFLEIYYNRDLAELPISLGQLANLSSINYLCTLILPQTSEAILNLCRAKREEMVRQLE